MAQGGPKRGPGEHQNGPNSAQERTKIAPRWAQEAIFGAPEGENNVKAPPSLIDRLQNRPKRDPKAPTGASRGPQDRPKTAPSGHEGSLGGHQKAKTLQNLKGNQPHQPAVRQVV
eukprot:1269454-Pyramimonas_sp.AAC.1